MGAERLELRPVDDETLASLETLLDASGLPTEGLRSTSGRFYLGYAGERPVAGGGIEAYGTQGLLRSVVVEESVRGRGYGRALTDALEDAAARDGVETLYLLTETAESFFSERGYRRVARADAPRAIRRTTEFGVLCPASATCMAKTL
jgi:amino-acid N-acetyltransferase